MLDNTDNYDEEVAPLFKLLRTPAFRFIVVSFNHYDLLKQLESDLRQNFPDQPFQKIDVSAADYRQISDAYQALGRGFLWLENFDDALEEERDSHGVEYYAMAADNERRRGITAGLNLRRDKLAQSPIALFVFIPAASHERLGRLMMDKMPDLWSFRSLIIDLRKHIEKREIEAELRQISISTLGGSTAKEKSNELERLLKQLERTDSKETSFLLTLYPQIVQLQSDLGLYKEAIATLESWERLLSEEEKFNVLKQKGDLYRDSGNLSSALNTYENINKIFEEKIKSSPTLEFVHDLAVSYERLGDTHSALGDLQKAMEFFEKYNELTKELYEANPQNVSFKNSLAISYSKLGDTHRALGDLQKALEFYQERSRLGKELYEANPQNVSFKNGLAISYSTLGDTHRALGDLQKAVEFFAKYNELTKELYEANPQNVSFKNSLAISYSKLGDTHRALGDLQKALEFYQERSRLGKELYEANPQNVSFKNGLAIAYSKLGETHSALGNLQKALEFFEKDAQLSKELYDDYPQNVSFKNGLAVSYSKLGMCNLVLNNANTALDNFISSFNLLLELFQQFPQNVSYTANYAEALSVIYSMNLLIGKSINQKNIDTAIEIFEELFEKTLINIYKRKLDICVQMKQANTDYKKLIIEISSF